MALVMNEIETQRLAAAVNQLRPDWPAASLRTLLQRPELRDRPYRDLAVALAWVAADPVSKTPARVLEAGPWWRAAAVDGTGRGLNQVPRERRCTTCSLDHDSCRRVFGDDHEFAPDFHVDRPVEALVQTVGALRGEVKPMRPRVTEE